MSGIGAHNPRRLRLRAVTELAAAGPLYTIALAAAEIARTAAKANSATRRAG